MLTPQSLVRVPADLQVPTEPLDETLACPEPLTRTCLLEYNNYVLQEWAKAARKSNSWIDWCLDEGYCDRPDRTD